MTPLLSVALSVVKAWTGRPAPVYAHYGVTHRCNMRCRMCAVWKSGSAAAELTVAQAGRLARGLWAAGVRSIALGGGEPSVRRDLPELVAAFSGLGMDVRLLTNGVQVSYELIDELALAGLRHVSVSLDSLEPSKERDIYGGRDVWHEIVDSIRGFRMKLPSRRSMHVINVCVSRLNLDELPALVSFARSLGVLCSFVPITLAADENDSDGFAAAAPDMAIRPADFDRVDQAYSSLLQLKGAGAGIANSSRFLKDSRVYLKTGRMPWRCDAGRLYLSISPDGGISMCHRFPPFARFSDQDLGARMMEPGLRKEFRARRRGCPGCMRPCWAEATHLFGNPVSALEALRLLLR
ncbi:MAG: radical SAM protein [Lentisphaerae bacterium]|nr:radical SAM protein [Lentisphaerota bacterium]